MTFCNKILSLLVIFFVCAQLVFSDPPSRVDTDLYSAARWGHIDKIKNLITKGPTQEGINAAFRTALTSRSLDSEKRRTVLALLIEGGADVNQKDKSGNPLLLAVAKVNNPRLLEFLLQKGGKADLSSELGGSQLIHSASFEGNKGNVEVLLRYGAQADARSSSGNTPLHSAAVRGNIMSIEVAKLLLAENADVNALTKSGWTPLMLTVRNGKYEFAVFLLENGADPNIETEKGHRSLDIVKAYYERVRNHESINVRKKAEGYKKIIQFLEKNGAKEGKQYIPPGGK